MCFMLVSLCLCHELSLLTLQCFKVLPGGTFTCSLHAKSWCAPPARTGLRCRNYFIIPFFFSFVPFFSFFFADT